MAELLRGESLVIRELPVDCPPVLPFPELLWRLRLRLFHGQNMWHNRRFSPAFGLRDAEAGKGLVFSYRGWEVPALPAVELQASRSGACNLLLSGPSVRLLPDPALLAGRPTICVNGSPALLLERGLPYDFYVVDDLGYVKRQPAAFERYSAAARHTLINHGIAYELCARRLLVKGALLAESRNGPYLRPNPYRKPGYFPFSRHFSEGLQSSGTIAYLCLQLAWCLGFREVFIYGMDLSPDGARYYPEARPEESRLDREYALEILPSLEVVGALVRAGDWKVWNCSPGSRLPASVLPKLDPTLSLQPSHNVGFGVADVE